MFGCKRPYLLIQPTIYRSILQQLIQNHIFISSWENSERTPAQTRGIFDTFQRLHEEIQMGILFYFSNHVDDTKYCVYISTQIQLFVTRRIGTLTKNNVII